MIFFYTSGFKRSFKRFSKNIRTKFYKQANFLLKDIHHPSLHAKKYSEPLDIWQARVDANIRFYFLMRDESYIFLDIRKHTD